jgi:hypothetical protein
MRHESGGGLQLQGAKGTGSGETGGQRRFWYRLIGAGVPETPTNQSAPRWTYSLSTKHRNRA